MATFILLALIGGALVLALFGTFIIVLEVRRRRTQKKISPLLGVVAPADPE